MATKIGVELYFWHWTSLGSMKTEHNTKLYKFNPYANMGNIKKMRRKYK